MSVFGGAILIVGVAGAGVCLLALCLLVVSHMRADLGVHADDDGEGE